jgi:hypothetical protein
MGDLIKVENSTETKPASLAVATRTRTFKNMKTGKTFEVKEGEPFRHFNLPGETAAYSVDDLVDFLKRNVGEVREVDERNSIKELPIEDLQVADLFVGGSK